MRLAFVLALALAGCAEHGSGGGGACTGLSLLDCRAASACKPDICPGCFCDLGFRGCVDANVAVAPCPPLGCPGAQCCSTQDQCTNGTTCLPPGSDVGCGACNTQAGDCTSDEQCKAMGPLFICQPIQCTCTGEQTCVQGCFSDDQCGDAEQCDFATARCVGRDCAGETDCPAAFHCVETKCARATCATDADCDGFCVLGQCFANARGTCTAPAP
jgi:hypothetical protein